MPIVTYAQKGAAKISIFSSSYREMCAAPLPENQNGHTAVTSEKFVIDSRRPREYHRSPTLFIIEPKPGIKNISLLYADNLDEFVN